MKTFSFFLFSLIALTMSSYAQSPNWIWAKSGGGGSYDFSMNVTTDGNGNVYVTGYFYDTSITFGTITLNNVGDADMFIVKYDTSGNVVWAQSAGGIGADVGVSVITDGNENVYVTGYFSNSTITFGTTTLNNVGVGYSDIFIVKYDQNGNVVWAQSAGGSNYDKASYVTTDSSGYIYVTGHFDSSSLSFGTTTLNNSGGNTPVFTVKFDSNGNVIWAQSGGGGSFDFSTSIATDASGNVYVTGYFNNNAITFGTTTCYNASVTTRDIFIVKYDSIGNVIWVQSAGGLDNDESYSLTTDGSGNLYVTGYFYSSFFKFGTTTLNNAGGTTTADIFIVKYDSNGNVIWAESVGGSDSDISKGIATDGSENVYVTGYFYSSSITFGTTTLNNAGARDIFITKYDSNGNIIWAESAGGNSTDISKSIATDASGNVYVTGYFYSPSITFGTTTLLNNNSTYVYADIFIVKLSEDNITEIVKQSDEMKVNVFPNPNNGQFHISGYGLQEIKIYTVLGESVYQSSINNSQSIIDLSGQAKGIYFYQLQNSGYPEVLKAGKIVIE